MAAVATGYITTNTTTPLPGVPTGGKQSFPGTFAVWGTFGGTTIKLQAGFIDNAGTLQWQDISGASFTAAGAVNIAVRCDALQIITASGSGANIGYWIG
jgi:hypothetical protein